ncbi:MAG: M28 family peptidase [Anaerolineales bacterium]
MKRKTLLLLSLLGLLVVGSLLLARSLSPAARRAFDGRRAYADVIYQVNLGPRVPGSPAHAQAIAWIRSELERAGWQVSIQESEWNGQPVHNLLARRSDEPPALLLGAHYDSRPLADRDPGPESGLPVPGANDGASGVAVLLELARSLPADTVPVWLVFFDAEDGGGLPGGDWIAGSRAFAASLTAAPQAVVIVDMVGDADLNLYYEHNSHPALRAEIWAQAAALGYGQQFIAEVKYSMLDDHTPFLELGLPTVLIIDFDYPYWHTRADTADKVSAESLQAVGDTLWHWIVSQR